MLKRKRAKEKGIVGLSKKFKEFKKGSKAILVRKLGGKESFPRQFNGLTVEIQGKAGKAYIVKFLNKKISKTLTVAPLHLKQIKNDSK